VTRAVTLIGLIMLLAAAPASAKTRHCPTTSAEKLTAIGTTCGDARVLVHDYYAHEPVCRPLRVTRSTCTIRGSRFRYRCTVVFVDEADRRVSCVAVSRARDARVRFTDIIGDEGRYP
jgi:hypothetical protein